MRRLACSTLVVGIALTGCTAKVQPQPQAVAQMPPPAQPQAAPPAPAPPAAAVPPPATPPPPPPVAATDPHLEAAIQSLEKAKSDLTAAASNKHGHRAIGLGLIERGSGECKTTLAILARSEAGEPEPPAEPEPVSEEVPDGATQPHMAATVVDLREALKQLASATFKNRHRAIAEVLTKTAIDEVYEGIWAAQPHPRAKPKPAAMKEADPHMEAGRQAIEHAVTTLAAAVTPKSGLHAEALLLMRAAADEAELGVGFAIARKKDKALPAPPAAELPVSTEVKGADADPQLAAAIVDLREAAKQIHDAGWDNGHRRNAQVLVHLAERAIGRELAGADKAAHE